MPMPMKSNTYRVLIHNARHDRPSKELLERVLDSLTVIKFLFLEGDYPDRDSLAEQHIQKIIEVMNDLEQRGVF